MVLTTRLLCLRCKAPLVANDLSKLTGDITFSCPPCYKQLSELAEFAASIEAFLVMRKVEKDAQKSAD